MFRKAFTLIELLVVIAIIAILAAILFPVFAQAKAAAKKTASLSNVKQVSLGAIMYGADADDYLPLMMNGSYTYLGSPTATQRTDSWVYATQPYIKSLQLLVDPTTSDASNIFGSGPFAWYRNQNLFPYFGYNYLFLSPWADCDRSEGRSATSANEPANTVMFTQSRHPNYSSNLGYFTATAPGMYPVILPHPTYCIWTGAGWSQKPASTPTTPYTAEIALRVGDGTNVAWVDGHSKYTKASQLAAGTDYATSTDPTATKITDKTQYLWNMDDNYFGG